LGVYIENTDDVLFDLTQLVNLLDPRRIFLFGLFGCLILRGEHLQVFSTVVHHLPQVALNAWPKLFYLSGGPANQPNLVFQFTKKNFESATLVCI